MAGIGKTSFSGRSPYRNKTNSSSLPFVTELTTLYNHISFCANRASCYKFPTTRDLECGAEVVLRELSTSAAEFAIAICWDCSSNITHSAAKLIYRILLLFPKFGISLKGLFELLRTKAKCEANFGTLLHLEPAASAAFDEIVRGCGAQPHVINHCSRNAVAIMIRNLYASAADLTFDCVKAGFRSFPPAAAIIKSTYEVLLNLFVLLRLRRISYLPIAKVIKSYTSSAPLNWAEDFH
ncbi:MAG: hypothetical protein ACTS46_01080 [Candidatus Hodgkinia cicadicola]